MLILQLQNQSQKFHDRLIKDYMNWLTQMITSVGCWMFATRKKTCSIL